MKEKFVKILFILVACFMFILPVYAEEGETPSGGNTEEETTTTTTTTTKAITTKTTTTKKSTTTTKAKSSNAYLERILVNGEAIDDFDKTIKKYNVKVSYETTKATIRAVAEDDNAIVKVEGKNKLEVGENEFTISVTSEDQTTNNYKVIVERKEKNKAASTKLKNIKVVGYKLDFDKVSTTFHLKIDKEDTELDIVATPVDEDAEVKIEGNEDLETGSTIKIIVTSSDGEKATYKIIIDKSESNPMPFIIIGIILLIVIAVAIFIFIQNKKQDKEDKIKEKREENEKKRLRKEAGDEEDNDDFDELAEDNDEMEKTRQMPIIDNDEEEKTRMFSFEKDDFEPETEEELEKTKVIKFSYDEDE